MKLLLGAIFFLIHAVGSAQDNFAKQIQAVVKDTANGFRTLRGKRNKPDFTYAPKIKIDGTDSGQIYSIEPTHYFYYMEVVGSESENPHLADSVLKMWVKKLADVLGKSFVQTEDKAPAGLKAYYVKGTLFRHGHLSLSVNQWRRFLGSKPVDFVRLFFIFRP